MGGTPPDVYRHDARCVSECDVFIMAPGAASTGLGIEAQIAANTEKLAILLLRTGERVSRMLLGCPNPNQIVVEYDTVEEALQKIDALIEKRVDRTRQGVFVFEDEVRVA